MRREAFEAIGGFDERYFMYMEDVDLGDRLGKAGWLNLYAPGAEVTREEILKFYEGRTVAKWQVPDDVVFVDAIPLGATGKMLKTRLREQLKDYKLPTA